MNVPARVFVPFFIASLSLTLTWGATLGMINLARLTAGWGLGGLPRPSVWAHAYVQVFGFMALFIMGVACHVIPRFVGGTLQHPRLVRWTFWLQLAGVVAIACGFFHGAPLTRPLWIVGSALLVAAAISFARVMLATMRAGLPGREPFRRWIAAGTLWMIAASVLAAVAALTDDVTWHRVLWMAALYGFISSWIFGVGRRILPTFLGCHPRWPSIERGVFVLYQVGAAAWVTGAWPDSGAALVWLRAAGGGLLIVSVTLHTACLGLFAPAGPLLGCAVRSPQHGWERYVFAAWGWLFAGLALGPGWTIVQLLAGGSELVLMLDVARHTMALGFATQMVLGVASRVVPNFTGKPLWSPRARDAAFVLLNASMLFRALELPIAFGLWVGAWSYIAWSGPLGVAAMVLFASNIVMTVRQPSRALQPGIPAHMLEPMTVRK
jgi:hypothetical protein